MKKFANGAVFTALLAATALAVTLDVRRDESGVSGYSIIRFALTDGFKIDRLPVCQIDGNSKHLMRVTDTCDAGTIDPDGHTIVVNHLQEVVGV